MRGETDPTKINWRIPNAAELAAWLKAHRNALQPPLSQRELAAIARMSRISVWRIENCATTRTERKVPSINLACRLWAIVRAIESGNLNLVRRVVIRTGGDKADS